MAILGKIKKSVASLQPPKPPPHPAVGAAKAAGRKASRLFKESPGYRGFGHFGKYVADRTGLQADDIAPPIDQEIGQSVLTESSKPLPTDTPEQIANKAKYGYDYQSILDASGGLKAGYSMEGGAPWSTARLAAEDINRGSLLDSATASGLGQRLGAETALAARGGLMGGARERLMRSSARDVAANRQGVRLQSELNKLGIMSKAADLDRGAQQFNIQNMIGATQASNLAAEEALNRKLADEAAKRQAAAIARG